MHAFDSVQSRVISSRSAAPRTAFQNLSENVQIAKTMSSARPADEHINSYYAASANARPQRAALGESLQADVCVIGGGFSGLSAALHLAAQGRHVTLLEAARIGWGASGRNGGQIVHGLNASLETIEKRYGSDTANFVGGLVQEDASIIRGFIKDYAIECDLKRRNIFVAFNACQMRELEAKKALWQRHGMDDHELLDKEALQKHVGSALYCGGMLDHSGGHLHPLNLALGEAAALEKLGGVIYEQSRVKHINSIESSPEVITEHGSVKCRTLIICGNAYLGESVPALAHRVMPVSTQVMATAPLSEDLAKQLLPSDSCIEDV